MQATKRVTRGTSKPASLANAPTHLFGMAPPGPLGLHHKPDRLTETLISPRPGQVEGARQPIGLGIVSHSRTATADREAVADGRSYAQSPAEPAQVSRLIWSAVAQLAVVRAGPFRMWWRTWVPCSERWSIPGPARRRDRPTERPKSSVSGRPGLECFAAVETTGPYSHRGRICMGVPVRRA
jgi:hypothetical protein